MGGGSEIGICRPEIEARIICRRLNDEALKRGVTVEDSSGERLPQRVKEVIIYPRSGGCSCSRIIHTVGKVHFALLNRHELFLRSASVPGCIFPVFGFLRFELSQF